MASTNENVSNSIPDDLAFDILSKLPIKSLKRFSCVRKSWADLFENPDFMSKYRKNFLSKDDNNDSSVVLKHSMPNSHQYGLFLLSGERFEDRVKLDWPSPFDDHHINIFILGSGINGILCLYQDALSGPRSHLTLKVVLWNPATEEFQIIPPGTIKCPPGLDICVYLHGFGYDPVTHDYKIIRYISLFEDDFYWINNADNLPESSENDANDLPEFPEPLWQIYSQRSNSWRTLDVNMPTHALNPTGFEVYLNGVCHWWGYIDSSQEVLVSFNLSSEVFHTTPLVCHTSHALHRHLVVLNGSIAMLTMYEGASFDISILGEVGVKESWTKLFTIGPLPFIGYPIGVGKKGDIFFSKYDVFLDKNDNELVWFDISTQMIKDMAVNGDGVYCQIVTYKESLLPIGLEG